MHPHPNPSHLPRPACRRRGSAMLEFAISFGLLLTIFSGVWQFGYTFYLYNSLESAVRNGARYGSLAVYDGGSWNGANFKDRVKNMVVYGNSAPPAGARPVVPGLATSQVRVTPTMNGVTPNRITVDIDGYAINTFFKTYTLRQKPKCSFDYMGRFTVP